VELAGGGGVSRKRGIEDLPKAGHLAKILSKKLKEKFKEEDMAPPILMRSSQAQLFGKKETHLRGTGRRTSKGAK